MKRDWLLYLVVFSLALNAGIIGVFAYLRYQDRQAASFREDPPPPPMRELFRRLNLKPEQRQTFRRFGDEHRQRLREMRQELMTRRQELIGLMKADPLPSWPVLQAKVREISAVQGRLEEEVVQHLLKLQQHLDQEQRVAMTAFMERRLAEFQTGRGRGWKGRRGGSRPPGGPECPSPPPDR
jgi:Spy/CpxP family protein refolding chaperone